MDSDDDEVLLLEEMAELMAHKAASKLVNPLYVDSNPESFDCEPPNVALPVTSAPSRAQQLAAVQEMRRALTQLETRAAALSNNSTRRLDLARAEYSATLEALVVAENTVANLEDKLESAEDRKKQAVDVVIR